jgi:hypothetical protein
MVNGTMYLKRKPDTSERILIRQLELEERLFTKWIYTGIPVMNNLSIWGE